MTHRLVRLRPRISLPSPSSAARIAEAVQMAGLLAFSHDRQAAPADLIAAHVYALALAIAAVDDVTDPGGHQHTLAGAVEGLTASVARARLQLQDDPAVSAD